MGIEQISVDAGKHDEVTKQLMNAAARIAIIYKPLADCLGYGGFMERGLKRLCKVDHFIPGDELPGYDQYWYIDDGPTEYMEPKYHPATYFAIDMVVQPFWYLQPVETYFQRLLNFDQACVTSTATLKYCLDRGYPARFIGFYWANPKEPDCRASFVRAVREYGLKGLKLNPIIDSYQANHSVVFPLMEAAEERTGRLICASVCAMIYGHSRL